jgi:hypothetical protein
MDPDPDPYPSIFVIDLQDVNEKLIFVQTISPYYPYFLKVHLRHFSKIKSQKESQNSRNQGFSYNFYMITGSGSGSRKPKNMWIRIRIRNMGGRECGSGNAEVVGGNGN